MPAIRVPPLARRKPSPDRAALASLGVKTVLSGRCSSLRGRPPSAPLSQGIDKRPHLVTLRASEDLIGTRLRAIAAELRALIQQWLAAHVAAADGPAPEADFVDLRGRDLVGGVHDRLAARRQNGGDGGRPEGLNGFA